jgi:DNA-binding transcriptional LysR family regulator
MSEFSDAELRRLDLTLLLVLLGLLRHRRAATVARELGLTPSAVSQALRRLRDIFGDELFLRRPHGLAPTDTALALEAPVAAAVEALRGALGAAQAFDPARAEGTIRIAALDLEQATLLPSLSARVRREAPGLRLVALPLGRGAAVAALAEGRVDLALGYIWDAPGAISSRPLFDEGYRVVGAPASLPAAPDLDLDAYCAAEHILVSPSGDLTGVADRALARLGRGRRVVLALPAFLPALAAAAETGALVTLPSRLARGAAPAFGLVSAAPPLALRPFTISVFWHRRDESSPKLAWLLARLADQERPPATRFREDI